jgi:hypothetical protein
LEDPLAEELLLGHFKDGDAILVKRKEETDDLYFIHDEKKSQSEEEPTAKSEQADSIDKTSDEKPE